MPCRSLTLATLVLLPLAAQAQPAALPTDLSSLTDEQRRALVPTLPREQVAKLIESTPIETLIEIGRRSVQSLGTYRATMTKQERIGGKLLPVQVMEATIRASPFAVTLYFKEGPGKGRRVLYDESLNAEELRVREPGLLGMVALWIDINGKLAMADTIHTIRETGFASLLGIFGRDVATAAKFGGFDRTSEGFNGKGQHCSLFKAPATAKGNYSERTRVCIDPLVGLPMHMMSYDKDGLFEDVSYSNVQANVPLSPDYFTLKAHGL